MTVGVQKSGNKIQYCRNRKGCHPLREFPYDDANITARESFVFPLAGA